MSGYSTVYAAGTATPQTQHSVAPEALFMAKRTSDGAPDTAENLVALQQVENLKYFLISAPVDWNPSQAVRKFLLPTGEYVSCVLWNNLFHITGTDIVRVLFFRFQAFGRPVKNTKKFEEGVFSDLRNLKSGTDACLEEPKSPFLDFLYKHNCIRTQKKQKVFFWYSVPHDRLFLDALERDLKRQRIGQTPTTVAVSEPALSFQYDTSRSLFEQLSKAQQASTSVFQPHAMNPSTFMGAQTGGLNASAYIPTVPPLDTGYDHQAMQQTMQPAMQPTIMNMIGLNGVSEQHVTTDMSIVATTPDVQDQCGSAISMMSSLPPRQYSHFSSMEPSEIGTPQGHFPTRDTSVVSTHSFHSLPGTGLMSADAFSDVVNEGHFSDAHSIVSSQYDPSGSRSVSVMTNGYPVSASPFSGTPSIGWDGSPSYKQRRRKESLAAGYAAVTASGNRSMYRTGHGPLANVARPVITSNNAGPYGHTLPSNFVSPGGTSSPESYAGSATFSASVVPRQNQALQSLESFSDIDGLTDFNGMGSVVSCINDDGTIDSMTPVLSLPETAPPVLETRSLTPGIFSFPNGVNLHLPSSAPFSNRRARSATISVLPTKSFSCPIPNCGRKFSRLEHLKRHRRTHEQIEALRASQDALSGVVSQSTMVDLSSTYINSLAQTDSPLSSVDPSCSSISPGCTGSGPQQLNPQNPFCTFV